LEIAKLGNIPIEGHALRRWVRKRPELVSQSAEPALAPATV